MPWGKNLGSVKTCREEQDSPELLAFNLGLKDEQVLATYRVGQGAS